MLILGHRCVYFPYYLLFLMAILLGVIIGIESFFDPTTKTNLSLVIPNIIFSVFWTVICLNCLRSMTVRIKRGRLVNGTIDKYLLDQIGGVGVSWVADGWRPVMYHLPVIVDKEGRPQAELLALATYWWRSKPSRGSIKRAKRLAKWLGVPYAGVIDLDSAPQGSG